jgi:glycosyltransferase involved in cell wall biosynthesis
VSQFSKPHLLILSESFPLNGGEPVMFDEIIHISGEFEKVEILPLYTYGDPDEIPSNCTVVRENYESVRLREFLFRYGWRVLKLCISELIISSRRWWYIKNAKLVFNTILGWKSLVYRIESAKKRFPTGTVLYSIWFNDWMNACFLASAHKHFKIVTRILGYDFDRRQSGYNLIPFRETMVKYPIQILSNSDYGKAYYKKYHQKAFFKVKVRKFGIASHSDFNPGQKDKYIYVSVAAAIPLKRIGLTIDLLSELNSPFHWYYFGNGPLLAELKQLARQKLPSGSYSFMGFRPREEIYAFYRQQPVTAFLHLSELESLPVCLMEAASFGIPLVACDTCGVSEIANSNTGLLLPIHFEVPKWSVEIEKFSGDKAVDRSFREQVKTYCLQNFDMAKNARETAISLKGISSIPETKKSPARIKDEQ